MLLILTDESIKGTGWKTNGSSRTFIIKKFVWKSTDLGLETYFYFHGYLPVYCFSYDLIVPLFHTLYHFTL